MNTPSLVSVARAKSILLLRRQYFQVLVAILLGGGLGYVEPKFAVQLKPIGDTFISLIRMLTGPIVFCTVVCGIAGMGDVKKLGRVGAKTLLYFELVSTLSLVVGLVGGHLLRPGIGYRLTSASLDVSDIAQYASGAHKQNAVDMLKHVVPETFASAFVGGNLLQVLLVSVIAGLALVTIGERGRMVSDFIDSFASMLFGMVRIVMKGATLGAFGAIAFAVGTFGVGSVAPLLKLIGAFYITITFFVVVVLGAICRLAGFSVSSFIRYVGSELLIVLSTSSSEAALPQMLEKLARLGCSRSIVGLVVPAGYSFNLDGTNIYMTMAVLFISQIFNVDLSWEQQLTLIGVAMLTSKGASGVAGAAFVMLTSTLTAFPVIPVSGMVLLLGIHRFMGTGLAIVNTVGNGVAAIVISAWEDELDWSMLKRTLQKSNDH
ncbi:C4-dicarboxylate transporter DctA [Paraburkholderia heleia]|uniref:C4-dicarboxylate transporter DctA n=1 Tax=Paraburkholderia heleia TaxID=634127 RepID=UPI003CD0A2B1